MTRRTVTDLAVVLERAARVRARMFRLEVLQSYDVRYEQDAFRAFLQAGAVDLSPGPWQALVARHVAAGRRCQRVHVVEEPLTAYLRYELAAPYARSAAAGEEIGILPVEPGRWPAGIPRIDFWLMDGGGVDGEVWTMHYDPEGRFVSIDVDDDPAVVAEHERAAEAAVARAVPLEQYLTRP